MRSWNYAAGSPNLGWTDHLTLEELQVLWGLTCIWRRDNEPDIGTAGDFDEMMRLGVRKLTEECGYEWQAQIDVDENLEVWVNYTDHTPAAKAVRGFLEHLATALLAPIPWPNYETAFKATIAFLERELPHELQLIGRVKDELAMIYDQVQKAKLGAFDEEAFAEMIREQNERRLERTPGSVVN